MLDTLPSRHAVPVKAGGVWCVRVKAWLQWGPVTAKRTNAGAAQKRFPGRYLGNMINMIA